jgi:hypothetical protein
VIKAGCLQDGIENVCGTFPSSLGHGEFPFLFSVSTTLAVSVLSNERRRRPGNRFSFGQGMKYPSLTPDWIHATGKAMDRCQRFCGIGTTIASRCVSELRCRNTTKEDGRCDRGFNGDHQII